MKKLFLVSVFITAMVISSVQLIKISIAQEEGVEIVLASEVNWEQLNPARGDKSPKAGTLWGDRKGSVPTGFLVKFVDGFSSPPHIHNVTYRGVVISGLIHNDDPSAAKMWMPAGSYWTQPKGEVHITAAKGNNNIAFIEIDRSPYLVLPTEEAFDSGEKPVNVDASNIVWVDPSGTNAPNGVKVAYLWGVQEEGETNGTLIKLPNEFNGTLNSHGSIFRAVVIQGQLNYQLPDEEDAKVLDPGSYFSSKNKTMHRVSSNAGETIIYIQSNGTIDF